MLDGMRVIDLAGERFGHLLVIERSFAKKRVSWLCRCDCGKTSVIGACPLRDGRTKSCGCCQGNFIHGRSYSPEFRSWWAMRQRCENSNLPRYYDWGGRGITVCDRWQKFENFFADMGEKPTPRHSIDRINNHGNYEPSNCRWATPKQQQRNSRRHER